MDQFVIPISGQALPYVVFGGVAAALGAMLMAIRDMMYGGRQLSDAALLKKLPKRVESPEELGPVARFDLWLERAAYLTNLHLSGTMTAALFLLIGLTGGAAAWVVTEDPTITMVVGVLVLIVCFVVLGIAADRQLKKFQAQFPGALDLLARAVRAGESLDQALYLVGDALADPVAGEFRRVAKHLEMGLSISVAMQSLSYRVPTMDTRIFASALSVHRDAGGNLPHTLERLSKVIRDRMAYHRQLKSVTGAGRVSATIIAAMGPILFAYLFFAQPEYGAMLWNDPTGRMVLIGAVVSEVIGLLIIWRMLKSDY